MWVDAKNHADYAEELLGSIESDPDLLPSAYLLAKQQVVLSAAQVHATLALYYMEVKPE